MNTAQFYYIYKALGISSFLQPQKIRSTYRLHYSSGKETDFMFFCNQLNTEKDRLLIQKIAQALGSSEYITVEVLDLQNPHTPFMLKNLLTRFLPKGFVIFGPDLASHLNPKGFDFMNSEQAPSTNINRKPEELSNEVSTKNPLGKTMATISINKNQHQSISGCVLNALNDFTGSDVKEVQERKKQAWKILKQIFPA